MTSCKTFFRICILFLFISRPSVTSGQDNTALNCSDIRNGTFNFFNQKEAELEIFIRKGDVQKEILTRRKETFFWEVNWLNDCTYTLKYQSGAENRTAAELKILNKHIIVVEVLHVTEDYMTFRTAFDKVTNPTVLNDTLWIKQRQSAKNKMTTNPRADSIAASKKRLIDSTQASYATLYVYRPGKLLDFAVTYDLLINGEKACEINNGCRYILKLLKPGVYNITAKLKGDQTVMLDVKPGGVYYIQCTATWGLKYHKEVQLMDIKEGAAAFNSSEKAN
jgi:Protein of unknown function (DUF2846)